MGNHDAVAGSIAVPALSPAVLQNEELVGIQVALDAQGLVGGLLLLVPHGQRVVGAGMRSDEFNPTHEIFLISRIARRGEAVIIVTTHAHDVPVAQAIVITIARVIEVGQA